MNPSSDVPVRDETLRFVARNLGDNERTFASSRSAGGYSESHPDKGPATLFGVMQEMLCDSGALDHYTVTWCFQATGLTCDDEGLHGPIWLGTHAAPTKSSADYRAVTTSAVAQELNAPEVVQALESRTSSDFGELKSALSELRVRRTELLKFVERVEHELGCRTRIQVLKVGSQEELEIGVFIDAVATAELLDRADNLLMDDEHEQLQDALVMLACPFSDG